MNEGVHHGLADAFRPSPAFKRFVATPWATALAALMATAGLLGGAFQLWRTEWLDGTITLAIGAVFAVVTLARLRSEE
jgi:hypothetical protein